MVWRQLLWVGVRPVLSTPSSSLHTSQLVQIPRKGGSSSSLSISEKSSLGARPDMGTLGERISELDSLDKRLDLPTLASLKAEYGGVRYDKLPICLIRCSKNNTKIAFKTHDDEDICYTSSTQEGFKNAKKKTMVAGQATGVAGALRALRRGLTHVRVLLKGLGPGRVASVKGLTLGGLTVVSLTDLTPLPEVGPRPQKMRRL